jgi:hypothetical protein
MIHGVKPALDADRRSTACSISAAPQPPGAAVPDLC